MLFWFSLIWTGLGWAGLGWAQGRLIGSETVGGGERGDGVVAVFGVVVAVVVGGGIEVGTG